MPEEIAKVSAPSWAAWIDPASKLGALSLFAIYALGYLVTSVHLAGMGMSLGNPLKPRIAAAGVLCCLLLGLPVWVLSETMRRSEPLHPELAARSWFVGIYKLVQFFHVALFLSIPLLVLFKFTEVGFGWRSAAILGLIVVVGALSVTARMSASFRAFLIRNPYCLNLIYPLFLVLPVALAMSTMRKDHFGFLTVPLWIFFCGTVVWSQKSPVSQAIGGTWPNAIVQTLAPIFVFATWIYPHVKSEWGGGAPVEIVVRFTKDSPVLPSQKIHLSMIDESDAGFSVLQFNHSHALFIPRSAVAALAYSEDTNDVP